MREEEREDKYVKFAVATEIFQDNIKFYFSKKNADVSPAVFIKKPVGNQH